MNGKTDNIKQLHSKLIENGRLIENQKLEIKRQKKELKKLKKDFLLEIVNVLDSFESKEDKISNKFGEEEGRKINKHFLTVKRRMLNILETNNVSKIKIEHYNINPKECIVEVTVKDAEQENEYISEVIKSGYMMEGEVIRFAEIIIVKND
jgi:molecular chaperone GrpE (heat shock protein)